jgi:hypothetical protein
MKKSFSILLLSAIFAAAGCSAGMVTNENLANAVPPVKTNDNAKPAQNSSGKTPANTTAATAKPADKSSCLTVKMDGKRLIASQTFVFEHEPFKGDCFVTFASKDDMLDEKDVPRGSTFHIFKDGKKVYDFDDAFDGQPACWVEAVGFEDVNADSKSDVVIAGKCLSAKDGYPVNAVFLNNGSKFSTSSDSNQLLENLSTVKAIVDFAKKNKDKFSAQ